MYAYISLCNVNLELIFFLIVLLHGYSFKHAYGIDCVATIASVTNRLCSKYCFLLPDLHFLM